MGHGYALLWPAIRGMILLLLCLDCVAVLAALLRMLFLVAVRKNLVVSDRVSIDLGHCASAGSFSLCSLTEMLLVAVGQLKVLRFRRRAKN